nr:putative mitochondrial protein [Quercus suber]
MALRDLGQFNDALLWKQVWRLYHEKDTLVYQVFQPKYLPNGSIFDAEITPRCSFAWKSILQPRTVICKGLGGLIVSPQRDLSLKVVQDLFIPGTRHWNEELIDRNFIPSEAICIKSIPVSAQASKDLLIWPLTSGGSYTVRSAYRLLAASHDALPGTSNPDGLKQLWSGIWKLQVPNKMCDHVKCIWFSDPPFNFPRARRFHRFSDLVSFVLSETTPNTAALFSLVAWCIWVRRNKIREGQQVWDVGDIVKRARDLLQEFRDVNTHQYRSATIRAVTKCSGRSSSFII